MQEIKNDNSNRLQITWLVNKMIKDIISPDDRLHDLVGDLCRLAGTHDSTVIKLGPKGETSVSFEVDYDILQYFIDRGILTTNALYTWQYSYTYVNNRKTSNYYNDFNLVWNSEREVDGVLKRFDERLKEAYDVILDMIEMVGTTDTILKIELYARTKGGIDTNVRITGKPEGINTDFKVAEIPIDPKNPAQGIISMLLWMMLEPNIFSAVKWRGNYLIYLDIYNLYDSKHVQSGTVAPEDRIDGLFVWTEGDPVYSLTKFNEFKERFEKCFEFGDIMHFLGFHNHELSDNFDTITDYIMNKVLDYFVEIGVIERDIDEDEEIPKIFDLRE